MGEMVRDNVEKQKWVNNVQENLKKLKFMSQNAPENYLNKIHLIEAEVAIIVNNNDHEGMHHYQKAISLSKQYNFNQEEALACERAGMYLWDSGKVESASKLLYQAFKCYGIWGAKAK